MACDRRGRLREVRMEDDRIAMVAYNELSVHRINPRPISTD
jgi:hypothetical protein